MDTLDGYIFCSHSWYIISIMYVYTGIPSNEISVLCGYKLWSILVWLKIKIKIKFYDINVPN